VPHTCAGLRALEDMDSWNEFGFWTQHRTLEPDCAIFMSVDYVNTKHVCMYFRGAVAHEIFEG